MLCVCGGGGGGGGGVLLSSKGHQDPRVSIGTSQKDRPRRHDKHLGRTGITHEQLSPLLAPIQDGQNRDAGRTSFDELARDDRNLPSAVERVSR